MKITPAKISSSLTKWNPKANPAEFDSNYQAIIREKPGDSYSLKVYLIKRVPKVQYPEKCQTSVIQGTQADIVKNLNLFGTML